MARNPGARPPGSLQERTIGGMFSNDAFGKLLRGMLGPPDPQPGPPYAHTLTHPETEEEMAAEPALPSFTVERGRRR